MCRKDSRMAVSLPPALCLIKENTLLRLKKHRFKKNKYYKKRKQVPNAVPKRTEKINQPLRLVN